MLLVHLSKQHLLENQITLSLTSVTPGEFVALYLFDLHDETHGKLLNYNTSNKFFTEQHNIFQIFIVGN